MISLSMISLSINKNKSENRPQETEVVFFLLFFLKHVPFRLFRILLLSLVCNDSWIFSLLIKNDAVKIMALHVAFLTTMNRY